MAADAAAIARIYNQGIAERIATFETELRHPDQIADQLLEKGDRYPTIVVERGGVVIGWASVGVYRDRACYAGVGEHSVYVDVAFRGQGAGRVALDALTDLCAKRGYWKLVSRIFPENVASLKLHTSAGFRIVGTYERHAKLDGEWRDCVIVEKVLAQ
jgi:L-amino acid N-acyltransferase YncA